jgi:hypothetical protein
VGVDHSGKAAFGGVASGAAPAIGRDNQSLCPSAAKLAEVGAGETIIYTALIWLCEMQGRIRLPKVK